MKKILFLILAVCMALPLAACGNSVSQDSSSPPAGNSNSNAGSNASSNAGSAATTYSMKIAMTSTSMIFASDIADVINAATNGRVTVEVIDSASLGSAADAVNMLRAGSLDLLMLPAAQAPGEFPVSDIVQVPFYAPTPYVAQDVMYALLEAGLLEEYFDEMVPLAFAITDEQMLAFKNNVVISSLSELKGMKIRAVSGITTNLVEDIMGASVVTMGMNDVYLSLSTGIIDAALSSPNQIVSNSLYDVISSLMDYPCFYGVLFIVANERLWNSLPSDIREQIQSACNTKRDQIREYYDSEGDNSRKTIMENNVNIYTPGQDLVNDLVTNGQILQKVFEDKLNDLGFDGAAVLAVANDVIAKAG